MLGILLVFASLLRAGQSADAGVAAGRGIDWQSGVSAALDRARRENRPVLVAINALDGEPGNRAMAFQRYREPALVAATRPIVCLVASPSNHSTDEGGACVRFGRIPCSGHQETLSWAMPRFSTGGNLVSPQHMILSPEGKLLWRQEYLIDSGALRRQLEIALVKTAPRRALQLAADTREDRLEALADGGNPTAYLRSGDPLAVAVLLLAYEEEEPAAAAKWLEALRKAPRESFGLVRLYVEDDAAFVPVAKAIDRRRGKWWERYHRGYRVKAEIHDPALRKAVGKALEGDGEALERVLDALAHPVDGPEVRSVLAGRGIVVRAAGSDREAWRKALARK